MACNWSDGWADRADPAAPAPSASSIIMVDGSPVAAYNIASTVASGSVPGSVASTVAHELDPQSQIPQTPAQAAAAAPLLLMKAMSDRHEELRNVEVCHLHVEGKTPYANPELKDSFIFKNNNNYREPLLFQKKINYTHNDIIELLEKLDNLWLDRRPKYDYIS